MLTPSNNASHSHANPFSNTFKEVLNRKLVFVLGKGGVGKSVVAESIAHSLSGRGKKTLLVTVEEPDAPTYQLTKVESQLWKINLEPF